MYLAKIALDISAKHSPNFIGYLDEDLYKKTLWNHTPLTDFWRVGQGTVRRLNVLGIYTMKDIAYANEDVLYNTFGIDAELLIDHAYGLEPTTMADIKKYHPKSNCLSSGQVLMCDYNFDDARLIVKEMTDLLCLDLVSQNLITGSITLHVGYSNQAHLNPSHGTTSLDFETNSDLMIIPQVVSLYENIVRRDVGIRRITITCNNVKAEEYVQYTFFADMEKLERNRKMQKAMIEIKNKFGKNAVLKGMDLQKNATTIERNRQIGGHKSGE